MLVQLLVVLIYSSKVPVRCTEEWNALIGELFILAKDVGVISRAHKHPGEIDKKVSFANKSVQLFNLHAKLVKK